MNRTPRSRNRGMSLVELMVGVAVGLFVVAAATVLASSQLVDNRKLILETKLQQDLRATADLMVRDIRRAGFATVNATLVPDPSAADPNRMGVSSSNGIRLQIPADPTTDALLYSYTRTVNTVNFGFKLDPNLVIRSCQTVRNDPDCNAVQGTWQEVSDPNVMEIKDANGNAGLTYSQVRSGARARAGNDSTMTLPCNNICASTPATPTACWPKVNVSELAIGLVGKSVVDGRVVRDLSSSLRVRNDNLAFGGADVPANRACPSPP